MLRFIKKKIIGFLSVCTLVGFSMLLFPNYSKPIKCASLNNQP